MNMAGLWIDVSSVDTRNDDGGDLPKPGVDRGLRLMAKSEKTSAWFPSSSVLASALGGLLLRSSGGGVTAMVK